MFKKVESIFQRCFSFISLAIIALYLMSPYVAAEQTNTIQKNPESKHLASAKNIYYFYSGSILSNEEDDTGDMTTYLGSDLRTIVNINLNNIIKSKFNVGDGKSIIAQIDTFDSSISNTYQYDPYGSQIAFYPNPNTHQLLTNNQLSIPTNSLQYDKYYYDQESGLYYLNTRYYSPTLMCFISMDTYNLSNRYAYCNGDPIGKEDPNGHCGIGFWALKYTEEFLKSMNPIELDTEGHIATSSTAIIQDISNVFEFVIPEVKIETIAEDAIAKLNEKFFEEKEEKASEDIIKQTISGKTHEEVTNDLKNIYEINKANIKCSRTAIDEIYKDFITEDRYASYSKDQLKILASELCYDQCIFENEYEAAFRSEYGDCGTQARVAYMELKDLDYKDIKIHVRYIDKKAEYNHAFVSLRNNGRTYILDTWAGKFGLIEDFSEYKTKLQKLYNYYDAIGTEEEAAQGYNISDLTNLNDSLVDDTKF